jgi:hypothetical protein
LLNEVIDYTNHGTWRWTDTMGDLVSTLFWPLVLSAAVRLRPFVKEEECRANAPSGDER